MSHSSNTERHLGFDFLKYICAFMVICIHVPYRGKTTLEPLTRIAVPIFFMITGYYYTRLKQKGRIKGQIKKILLLNLLANLGFILFDILLLLFQGAPVSAATAPWCTADAWIDFLVFNTPPVWTHVWYLSALLYVLIFIYLFEKIADRKKLYCFIPILLLMNLILGSYSTWLLNKSLPIKLSRNFLFTGLLCFLLGDLLYSFKGKIKLKSILLIAISGITVITTFIEHKFLLHINAGTNQDFFLSTIFMAASLFLLVDRCHNVFNRGICYKIAQMGKKFSLGIFILHPVIIRLVTKGIILLENSFPVMATVYFYTAPFIILLLSTLCAAGISSLTKYTKSV